MLDRFLSSILQLIANLDPRAALFLFIISAIGDFAIAIPYVMESVWLLVGYQLGSGQLSLPRLLLLWLAAQSGREVGSLALYSLARLGSSPITRLYRRVSSSRFWPKMSPGVVKRVNLTSAFSIGYGRLLGLRVPLTILLGFQGKLWTMLLGVLVSSVIWDAVYITLGATVGRTISLKPGEMLLFSIGGLTVIYIIVIVLRRLLRKPQAATDNPDGPHHH
jgi:membrane protein DedA with SNARE-associated domain